MAIHKCFIPSQPYFTLHKNTSKNYLHGIKKATGEMEKPLKAVVRDSEIGVRSHLNELTFSWWPEGPVLGI